MPDHERFEYLKGHSDGYDAGYKAAGTDFERGLAIGRRQVWEKTRVIMVVQTLACIVILSGRLFGWW